MIDGAQIAVVDQASLVEVRAAVQALGRAAGLDDTRRARIETAASELAQNQLDHAHGGHVELRATRRDGVDGVEVLASDHGFGLTDPRAALERGGSGSGLGVGLRGVCGLTDELDIDTRLGAGTRVWARVFAREVACRCDIAVMGVPHPDERISGDDALFVRSEHDVLCAVADGLGHGPDARVAAEAALAPLRSRPDADLTTLVEAAHEAARPTRGAALSMARVDARGDVVSCGLGNVAVSCFGVGHRERALVRGGTVGGRRRVRATLHTLHIAPHEVVVLATDGVRSTLDLSGEGALLRAEPIVIAHAILTRWLRAHDDATVLVLRRRVRA